MTGRHDRDRVLSLPNLVLPSHPEPRMQMNAMTPVGKFSKMEVYESKPMPAKTTDEKTVIVAAPVVDKRAMRIRAQNW